MSEEKEQSKPVEKKNIVKDIFDRPSASGRKVSALFTHFKTSQKNKKSTQKKPLRWIRRAKVHQQPVAIDIGTSSVKLLQLVSASQDNFAIACIDHENIPLGQGEAGLVATLKKIVDRNKVGPECLTTLFAKDFHIYNMTFPALSDKELDTAVRYKVAQVKPFNLAIEQIEFKYLKWDPIKDSKKGGQQRVFVLCVAREVLEKRIALLEGAGLKPVSIEIPSLSLIHLYKFYRPDELKNEVCLWLDIGADESFLTIESGGSVYFSRALGLTAGQMTQAIATHGHISENEAESIKRKYGLTHWAQQHKRASSMVKNTESCRMVYHGLSSLIENLVIDIEHTFKYFSYQVAQSQITKFDRVILSGGGSNLLYLDWFLSDRFDVPVERIDPFRMFSLANIMEQNVDLTTLPSNFAVCAGLALGYKAAPHKRLNFMPEKEPTPIESVIRVVKEAPAAALVASVALAFTMTAVQGVQSRHAAKHVEDLKKTKESIQASAGQEHRDQMDLSQLEANLNANRTVLLGRRNYLRTGYRQPEEFSKVLSVITQLVPADMWMTDMEFKEKRVTMTGMTQDLKRIGEFINQLKASEYFASAEFDYSRKEKDVNVYNFEIIARVSI